MSTAKQAAGQTKTAGAVKGGDGKFIFPLEQMGKIEAGVGYSTGVGPVVEGDRMQYYTIATEDEDVVFFAVKDLSHGINGIPVDPSKGVYTGNKK